MPRRTKKEIMEGVSDVVKYKSGNPKAKFVDRNTIEYFREDGTRVIRFHFTDIIEFAPDGTITFNSEGWRTYTTKERMNEFQNQVAIWQDHSKWYIGNVSWNCETRKLEGDKSLFYDGVKVKDRIVLEKLEENPLENRRIKQINKLCRKIRDMKEIPLPSNGDCLICQTQLQGTCFTVDKNNSKPDKIGIKVKLQSVDHLESHIKEGYVHGTLIFNALTWAGYNAGFIMEMGYRDIIIRTVRRFLKFQLGIAA